MHIPSFTAAAASLALAPLLATADQLETYSVSNANGIVGRFRTDYGEYTIDAADGCRSTPVPGMVEFCIDWGRNRGHFRFSHQSFKRCLRKSSSAGYDYGCPGAGGTPARCRYDRWDEVGCTWREEPVDVGNATVSVTVGHVTGTATAASWTGRLLRL